MELRPELETLKKSLTPEKIAEFTHQAVSRSDLNLLRTIYLYADAGMTMTFVKKVNKVRKVKKVILTFDFSDF